MFMRDDGRWWWWFVGIVTNDRNDEWLRGDGLICVCLSKVVATPVSSHCLFFFFFNIFSHKCFLVLSLAPNVYIYINYLLPIRGRSITISYNLNFLIQTSTFARTFFLIDLSIDYQAPRKTKSKFPFLSLPPKLYPKNIVRTIKARYLLSSLKRKKEKKLITIDKNYTKTRTSISR